MLVRWLPVLLPLSAASCAPPAQDPPPVVAEPPDCGMRFVVRRLMPRPGSGESRVRSGAAIPACALPTAADIASACRGPEGVPIPGTRDPDGGDGPRYEFPDYSVEGAACAFADAGRSGADCTFDLVGRASGPEQITARLHHRFHDLSNAIAHDYLLVAWQVDSICTAGP